MFIREKSVKGNKYAYLVSNKWVKGKVKQKVRRYLGRIHFFESIPNEIFKIYPDYKKTMKELIHREINRLKGNVKFSKNKIYINGKEGVVKCNDGYLCSYMLGRLLRWIPKHEEMNENAKEFAELLVSCGIKVSGKEFVQLVENYIVLNKIN